MKFHFIIVVLVLFSCKAPQKALNSKTGYEKNPVIAHRGAFKKNNFPENSIASLKEAIRLKCSGSEFDVRMTADDSLILNHDPDYNILPVEKTNYADLIAFKLSNGEKLPTLREYILAGLENNTSTKLVCEIKPSTISKERGKEIAARVLRLFKQLRAEQYVVYISFDYDILKEIIRLNPNAITQYLNGEKTPEQLKANGIAGADYHFSVFKYHPDWIESARKNGIILNAWTVNEAADMDWLLANGFDFITTNEPELLFERIKNSPTAAGWKLTWSDEFNYKGLPDSSKWNYNVGGHGWGNNELQYYTAMDTLNAKVGSGVLKISARKQTIENRQYTSARLVTKNKADFKYGRIEISVKLPKGRGTWPAVWMLGKNIDEVKWPACGEIDIMEHVGYEKDSIFGTIHTEAYNHMKGTQKGKGIFINSPYDSFHLYSIEWTPEKIDFMMDGVIYNHITNEHLTTKEWPFDQPFFLIINLAIGGNWGGARGVDENIFPAVMEVDYVRVFQTK
ncbi:MAG: family 16 glycosylhydrolase [Sphingobacteriales bacterium]|nr:family 16 glycosylhydrolase [Sphingobacteriales bacterium]